MATNQDSLIRQKLLELNPAELEAFERRLDITQAREKPQAVIRRQTDPSYGLESGPLAYFRVLAHPQARAELEKNIPESAEKSFRAMGDFVRNVLMPSEDSVEMYKGILQLGMSVRDANIHGVNPLRQEQQPLTAMTSEIGKSVADPEAIISDPFAGLTNMAALAPGGPKGSLMAKIGSKAEMLDPVVAASKAAGAGVNAGGKIPAVAERAAAETVGFLSGLGGERAKTAIEAGAEGQRPAFKKAIREGSPYQLGKQVVGSLERELNRLGNIKDKFLREQKPVDIADLKKKIIGNIEQGGAGGLLEEFRIKIVPDPNNGKILVRQGNYSTRVNIEVPESFRAADQGKIENILESILESSDEMPAIQLDDIKQGIDNITAPTPQGGRAVAEIRQAVRKKLGEIIGFDKVSDPIKDVYDQEKNISDRLVQSTMLPKGKKQVNPETVGKKIVDAPNIGTGQKDRLEALQRLEEQTGLPVKAESAGIGFQGFTPTGLTGKSEFMQRLAPIFAVGAGVGLGAIPPSTLLSLPAMSLAFVPRFAGQSLARLGQVTGPTDKLAKHLTSVAQDAVQQAQALGVNPRNLTLGQLIERFPDDAEAVENTTGIDWNRHTASWPGEQGAQAQGNSLFKALGRVTPTPAFSGAR